MSTRQSAVSIQPEEVLAFIRKNQPIHGVNTIAEHFKVSYGKIRSIVDALLVEGKVRCPGGGYYWAVPEDSF